MSDTLVTIGVYRLPAIRVKVFKAPRAYRAEVWTAESEHVLAIDVRDSLLEALGAALNSALVQAVREKNGASS